MNLQSIPRALTDSPPFDRILTGPRRPGKATSIDMARISRFAAVASVANSSMFRRVLTDYHEFQNTQALVRATHGEHVLKELESTALRMAISSLAPTKQNDLLRMLWRDLVDRETRAYTAPVWPEPQEGYNLRLTSFSKMVIYAVMWNTGTRSWHSNDWRKLPYRSTFSFSI